LGSGNLQNMFENHLLKTKKACWNVFGLAFKILVKNLNLPFILAKK
jgi:hypothetical protein